MTTEREEEIRCYGNPRVLKGFISIMTLYPIMLIVVSISDGNFFRVVWLPILIFLFLFLFWSVSRWGTYVVVNKAQKTLSASTFFMKTNEIPISSITHIGTRGMFLGVATGIQITYVKPNGQKKTLGYSTKDYLDPKRLHDILDVLVVINPKLNIPRELRNLA